MTGGAGGLAPRVWGRMPQPARDAAKRLWDPWARLTSSSRLLPDYVIVGAQRGGTTSLYRYLTAHPNVGHALTKELRFFDAHWDRGPDWYRSRFPSIARATRVSRGTGGPYVVGEASPDYLMCPHAPERMAGLLPDVRLIAMLRNPVDRAYSHYRHQVYQGHERLSFEEAIEAEPERLAGELERMLRDPGYVSFAWYHRSYVRRGQYADQLEPWFSRFEEDRWLIVRSEDFYQDPAEVYRRTLEFLGLPPWRPPRFETFNRMGSGWLDPATRARLVEHFRPHNARLAELLGYDLGWDR